MYETKLKYKHHQEYIIGNDDMKEHVFRILRLFSRTDGLRIIVQHHRRHIADEVITMFLPVGIRKRDEGEVITKNKKDKENREIHAIEIVIDKIGKIRF